MAKKRKPKVVPAKRVSRQIKSLKKGLAKEKQSRAKTDRRVVKKTEKLGTDMGKLKSEIEKLARKKTPKKQLSEYNLFMRRQLQGGKSFAQAVRLWKAYRKGRPLVRTKVVRRTIVRKVKVPAKPRIKYRTRTVTRTIVKRGKPKIVTRTVIRRIRAKPKKKAVKRKIKRKIKKRPARRKAAAGARQRQKSRVIVLPMASAGERQFLGPQMEKVIDKVVLKEAPVKEELSDEEIALEMVALYFEEIARIGFKRSLDLDQVINAYLYSLSRVRRSGIEMAEIVEAIKRNKLRSGRI